MNSDIADRLADVPRTPLISAPTPLESAPRLSEELGIELLLKRDDLTGIGCGGNKLRKLELILGEAMEAGVDTLLTTGGVQSNHARLTAAVASRLGLLCELYLRGETEPYICGNVLLDRLLGAHLHFCGTRTYDEIDADMERHAAGLRVKGRRPLVIPLGGATPEGTLGYALAFRELLQQCKTSGSAPDVVALAGGTGSTAAGLALGAKWWAPDTRIVAISVSWSGSDLVDAIARHFEAAAEYLKGPEQFGDACEVYDDYVGPGYNIPSESGLAALERLAQTEGVILDTTYTAKALAGLIDLCDHGKIQQGSRVVFVHTGGVPELFSRDASVVLGA